MIVKQFVEGFIANNNYLLIDEESKEAALIDCTDYISELGAVLKEYDAKLKYILLTHGHFENFGAIQDIAESLDKVPIYGSKFTIALLKKELETKKVSTKNLIEIPAYKTLNIGHVKVFPVGLSHSIPENFLQESSKTTVFRAVLVFFIIIGNKLVSWVKLF